MNLGLVWASALLGVCLSAFSAFSSANDWPLASSIQPGYTYTEPASSFRLADNDANTSVASRNIASATPSKNTEFKAPLFTLNKMHQYLGIATVIAAGLTAATAPDGCENNCTNYTPPTNGPHANLGRATRTLAIAAVVTGLVAHWDDMHPFEDGLRDPDTQHWLLASAGALLLANAVNQAPDRAHATQAELGAVAMLIAIKLVW